MIIESFSNFFNQVLLFTGFVNSANGFPKPLSSEEEKECLLKYKNNNDENAKKMLINHNLRLVAHIVKKYCTAGEADDFIGVGCIGLIKAINTFDMNKGTQLSTYAARCIENEILMLLRVNKKHNQVYSLEESLGLDKDGNEVTLEDVVGSGVDDLSEVIESKISSEKLTKQLKKDLPEREYKILCMRYGLNNTPALTQIEVAKKMGISRSYISRLENKALLTLKNLNIDKDI